MPGSSDVVLILALAAGVAVGALVLVVVLWLVDRARSRARLEKLLREQERGIADARRDSVQRSRFTLKGQIAEQMAPLLPGFRYLPADARFLGDPVDYVVFDGYTDARDRGMDAGLELVLLEVKQGSSALSPTQKLIARSVQEGRVRFEVLRVADDGALTTETWKPRAAGPAGRSPS